MLSLLVVSFALLHLTYQNELIVTLRTLEQLTF